MKRIVVTSIFIAAAHTVAHTSDVDSLIAYTWANYRQCNNQSQESAELYQELLAKSPSPHAYKGYIHFLHTGHNWSTILTLKDYVDTHFPHDVELHMIVAQAYEQTGNINACDELLIQLATQHVTNQSLMMAAAQAYMRRNETTNALAVIDSYLHHTPSKSHNFIFYYLQSQLYVQLNQRDKALAAIKKSIELHDHFDKSWLMMAILEEQQGNIQEATVGYSNFLQTTQVPNPTIEKHLQQLSRAMNRAQHQSPSMVEQVKQCTAAHEFDKALVLIDSCLNNAPENGDYQLLKLDILLSLDRYDDAYSLFASWMHHGADDPLWYTMLHTITIKTKQYDRALSLLQQQHAYNKKNELPLLYAADLAVRAQKQMLALVYLKKIEISPTIDAQKKARSLYQTALIYSDMKKPTAMKKALHHAIRVSKSYAPPFNMLAHHYAMKENNIKQAETFLNTALTIDPQNYHYIETAGIIAYKKHDFNKAIKFFEQALVSAPKDATLLQHMAQAWHANHDAKQASHFLAQARQYAQDPKKINKLEQIALRWNKQAHE